MSKVNCFLVTLISKTAPDFLQMLEMTDFLDEKISTGLVPRKQIQ